MTLFFAWLVMASVQLAATMSPGPAFVVAVRNAMKYDRKSAIATAFGLSLGVAAHVLFVLLGIAFLIAKSVFMLNFIRYAGAAYLFYIGIKAIRSTAKKDEDADSVHDTQMGEKATLGIKKAVITGFLTNLLNPKAVVFFTAVYAQFITPETPLFMHLVYGGTSVFIEFTWFACVAIVLTNPRLHAFFNRIMHRIERICGGLMIALGVKLALSK